MRCIRSLSKQISRCLHNYPALLLEASNDRTKPVCHRKRGKLKLSITLNCQTNFNLMQSFVEAIPPPLGKDRYRNYSDCLSSRRPRTLEKSTSISDAIPLRSPCRRHSASRIVCSAAPGMSQSHDDKQKDKSKRDEKANFERKNLEMGWKFQTRSNNQPVICETCKGTGRVECSWCHATGVLMLGDRLMCSVEGQSHCLACDNGEVKCKECKGTGMIASWMIMKDL